MAAERGGQVLHTLVCDARKSLRLSGVTNVSDYDAKRITLVTDAGALVISGDELHIERLDVDAGELSVTGRVDSLAYSEKRESGLLARLFG